MKTEILNILFCPVCQGAFRLNDPVTESGEVITGVLSCPCEKTVPIIAGIPRFVKTDNYVRSFSLEWNIHQKTQLDSNNNEAISEKEMRGRLNYDIGKLNGKLVLDAGCGSGRFAEVAAKYGAAVVCVDLSYSVESAYRNIGNLKNVNIIQADIFNLPFKPEVFDLVYSFGVLHHTPDARKAFSRLVKFLKPNGTMSIFVYSSYNKAIVYSSAFWRAFTTRLPKRLLYYFSYISLPLYYIYKIPVLGQIGKMIFVIPMWKNWRWRVLDTFDWYSPRYQSKHTHWEVFKWFEENGLKDIRIYPNEVTMSGVRQPE